MLVRCPECDREVSDRAPACPGCGFPIAQHMAEAAAARAVEVERKSRRSLGDTDCVACTARGFRAVRFEDDLGNERDGFQWCEICEHSGRVALCRSDAGYWAVRRAVLEAFLGGHLDDHATDAVPLGPEVPEDRYPSST